MARRRRFKRTSPDMGWIVTQGNIAGTITEISARFHNSEAIFGFLDIDELDTVMTKDKSDWFIKRVIVSAFPAIQRASGTSSPARIWNMALHTSMDAEHDVILANEQPIMTPEFYDSTRRLLRTYTRPVYDPWQPGVRTSGELVVETADNIQRFDSTQNYWGDAHVTDDFPVSNAGLVPTSSLYLSISSDVTGSAWQTSDDYLIYYTAQVLLQKRRGG